MFEKELEKQGVGIHETSTQIENTVQSQRWLV